MLKSDFEKILCLIADDLTLESKTGSGFKNAKEFEQRVREVSSSHLTAHGFQIDMSPASQAFPDVVIGEFGIEVKHTENDSWRCVANSVLESNRVLSVKHIYLVYCKMGGVPEVRWGRYEDCVMHVRTSHVPRFEVEIGAEVSLFSQMGISYDDFRLSDMHEKMQHIRAYARSRLREGERMWWLEDKPGEAHTLPINVRLYTKLTPAEKTRLRAEAVLLCPSVVSSGRSRSKYDDLVLYLLTYHGVLCHQARDLFSAGSVANPQNDDEGGVYIARALKLLEKDMRSASLTMDSALFVEYWGHDTANKSDRISEWLKLADAVSGPHWKPSDCLFNQ